MNSSHWRRDEPQFYRFLGLPREQLDGPHVIGGLTGILLSRDTSSDSHTYLVELPPGWCHLEAGREASLELFILRGDLSATDKKVGPSGYVHLPQGCGGENSAQRPARLPWFSGTPTCQLSHRRIHGTAPSK